MEWSKEWISLCLVPRPQYFATVMIAKAWEKAVQELGKSSIYNVGFIHMQCEHSLRSALTFVFPF